MFFNWIWPLDDTTAKEYLRHACEQQQNALRERSVFKMNLLTEVVDKVLC